MTESLKHMPLQERVHNFNDDNKTKREKMLVMICKKFRFLKHLLVMICGCFCEGKSSQ